MYCSKPLLMTGLYDGREMKFVGRWMKSLRGGGGKGIHGIIGKGEFPSFSLSHHRPQRLRFLCRVGEMAEKEPISDKAKDEIEKKKKEEDEVEESPPEKPLPGDCCGSGCVRCVWDLYYEELEDYNNRQKQKKNG
ncbi:uncharacterized protein LOC131239681 [Magnolia sinica]|uniref:uncharacterized protein LOC131239681 n=1 Tax=Magnolia sinica TaxID=86752 RepID=UPI0026583E09|nr:uncharacterized protein LOC131239681 [Magnolia sinica]